MNLFPDHARIHSALQRQTREALLKRLGAAATETNPDPLLPINAQRADAPRDKARGISFSRELVQAILAGTKTQTRRVIRPPPAVRPKDDQCPLGAPGDVLYVREPWLKVRDRAGVERIVYGADETKPTTRRFRPGMYMPRHAARLFIRLRSVAAERLSTITPAGIRAEGVATRPAFAALWDSFHTAPGETWSDDPWVWVLHFELLPQQAR